MAIAHDVASESHTSTTASFSEAFFQWTHTPSGTPKGVLIYVYTGANEADISSVTYGGITVPAVSSGEAVDTAGEPLRCSTFFLGKGIPTGAQTARVNRVNNATNMYAVCITVTANTAETAVAGVTLTQEDGTVAEVSVNDGSPGTNSLRYAGGSFGHQTLPTTGASSTALQSIDVGATGMVVVRETTAGQGARNVGMSSGTSDDRAIVSLAVTEKSTIEILGQALTLGRGDLAYDWKHLLSGQALSIVQGTPTVDIPVTTNVNLTGQALTLAQGTPTLSIDINVSLTGQVLSLTQSPNIASDISIYLIGQTLSLAQGALAYDWKHNLTGQALTLSLGNITQTFDFSLNLTGQALTSAQGTVSAGSSVSINLTGQTLALAQGTPTVNIPSGDITVNLLGQSLSLAQGTITQTISPNISIAGQQLTLARGNITQTISSNINLTGQQLTLSRGTPTQIISPNISLVGQALSLGRGDVTAGANTVSINLTGQTFHFTQSSTILTVTGPVLIGRQLSLGQGSVTVNVSSGSSIVINLVGQLLNLEQSPNVVEENQPLLVSQRLFLAQGIPTVQTFGTNATVNLVGQSLSLSQGTPQALFAQFIPVGRQLNLRQAPSTFRTDITLEIDGQALTLSQGTPLALPSTIVIPGRTLSISQGSVFVALSATVNLTGQQLTLARGTPTAGSVLTTVNIAGQSLSVSQGSILPTISLQVALTGQSLNFLQGSVLTNLSDFIVVFISGQTLVLSRGNVGYSDEVHLLGQPLSLGQGLVTFVGSDAIALIETPQSQSLRFGQGCVAVSIYEVASDTATLYQIDNNGVDIREDLDFDSGVGLLLTRECME